MPYPTQVTRERILQVAGELVEQGDIDTMTLAQLARRLNIKPPSLYRYFSSKAALIEALNRETMEHLTDLQNVTVTTKERDMHQVLLAIARRYRTYALAHPQRYQLAFRGAVSDSATQEAYLKMALPLQHAVSQIAAEDSSLAALRGLWALIHGFIMLEFANMFQRGGDLDSTFEAVLKAYLNGWT